jgi:hypothetical protein
MASLQPSARPIRRRWFSFTLGTLLILIAVCAVWLGIKTNRARRQKEAVKAIQAAGGQVRFDDQKVPMGAVQPQKQPGPKWLREIVGEEYFRKAVEVDWTNDKFRADDLRWLADLPALEQVNLNFSKVDDEGLAYLAKQTALKHVLLERCKNVTDEGLAHLAKLTDLQELALMGTSCTDEGIRMYVPKFTRLVYLDVAGIPITNETAKEFRHLKNLKMLHLSRTEERTPHDLSEAVQVLKKELPGCRINYWPPFESKHN